MYSRATPKMLSGLNIYDTILSAENIGFSIENTPQCNIFQSQLTRCLNKN